MLPTNRLEIILFKLSWSAHRSICQAYK